MKKFISQNKLSHLSKVLSIPDKVIHWSKKFSNRAKFGEAVGMTLLGVVKFLPEIFLGQGKFHQQSLSKFKVIINLISR